MKPEWAELEAAARRSPAAMAAPEDVLTHAMFPQVAPRFFATRKEGPKNVGESPTAGSPSTPPSSGVRGAGATATYAITLDGQVRKVTVTAVG